jgi:hydrid cluster protein-associated redox disulfide domain
VSKVISEITIYGGIKMSDEVFNAGNADVENITVTTGGDAPEAETVSADEMGSTAYSGAPEPGAPGKDGIIEYVNKEMLISDIVTWYPDATLVLMKIGMHCISCFAAQMETLEQAAAVHGYDPDDVAKIVNDYLTQTIGNKAGEAE